MAKQFCRRGHDVTVVGRATNRQCRQCRREQQTTPAYQARRRERQSTAEFRQQRWRYRVTHGGWVRERLQFLRLPKALRALIGV